MDKVSTITTLTTRRPRWQYPKSPPPRILHLPRRHRRKQPAKGNALKPGSQNHKKDKLESLFDQERKFARGVVPMVLMSDQCHEERRERVKERESVVMEEEKWRFQAEMLRAECNLLRIEREITVKKMERRRALVEKALRSAVHTLLSGRKISCEGKEARMVLEEEIIELVEKLEKLQRRSRSANKELRFRKISNFDKHVSHLQRQLEEFGDESDEIRVKEIQEMAEASLSVQTAMIGNENFTSNCISNMDIIRMKMEEFSKGNLLARMEVDCQSMISTANSSAVISRRTEFPEMSPSSERQLHKEQRPGEERPCSGGCKAIVRKVVEQVRAETEQWSQMQDMLEQVRNEMEELQISRDFWEDRALDSDYQIQTLQSAVKEWRMKAICSEEKAGELQAQVSVLRAELQGKEKANKTRSRSKNLAPNSQELPSEMEKRVLVCRLKENQCQDDGCRQKIGRKNVNASSNGLGEAKRSPFRDIGNSSSFPPPLPPVARQNIRAVFPLHCPPPSGGKRLAWNDNPDVVNVIQY